MPRPDPFGRHTLRRQLVIRVTALVALAALLITTATALATRQVLMSQLDRQLDAVTARVRDPVNTWPDRDPDRGLLRPGQPIGTLAVLYDNDGNPNLVGGSPSVVRPASRVQRSFLTPLFPNSQAYRPTERRAPLTSAGLATIEWSASESWSERQRSALWWSACRCGRSTRPSWSWSPLAALFSLLVIAGTAFAARSLVGRSLRPLNRVAATAQQVSQLKLDRGEVALAVRVPPADANPASEVGQVGQAINHMLNNVEEALAARQASETRVRQFVADASHELRNPLAAIRGYAELTRRDREKLPTDTAYAMSRVESEAERMSHLVEDMLLLARLDSGPDLDLKPTDLSEIVINAVSDARAAGPDHVWQMSLPHDPVLAYGDQHRLQQVMANLLANARTHTPAGTQCIPQSSPRTTRQLSQ